MKATQRRKAAAGILRQHALLVKGRILYIKPLTDAAIAADVVEAAEAYTGKMHCIRERPNTKGGIWDGPIRRLGVEKFTNGSGPTNDARVVVDVVPTDERNTSFTRVHPIVVRVNKINLQFTHDEAMTLVAGLITAAEAVAEEKK